MKTREIKEAEKLYEIINNKDKLILIDFYANWCGPCKVLSPILDKLAEDYTDNIIILKVDIEKNRDIVKEYSIKSIPTIIFYKNEMIVDKKVGNLSRVEIEDIINSHI